MSREDVSAAEPGTAGVDRGACEPAVRRAGIGASPVFTHVWPDCAELNAQLRRVVLDRMATSPGLQKSQCGGWQSERNLQLWQDPAIDALLGRVRAMVRSVVRATVHEPGEELLRGWDVEGWANVNQVGDSVSAHVHAGGVNMWAVVYYVDCGQDVGDVDAISSGFTRFLDMSGVPRPVSNRARRSNTSNGARDSNGLRPECGEPERSGEYDLQLTPTPGRMVVFPATLPHYVTPYVGADKRITIALNLRHTKFAVTDFENPYSRRRMLWRNYRGVMLVMFAGKRKLRSALAAVVPVHKWPSGLRRRLLGGG